MNNFDEDVARLRGLTGKKWHTYGEDALAAWVADMDLPAPTPIRDYLIEIADKSDFGYPADAGDDPLRHVFAARMHELYGWQPDPDNVEIVTDVVQALYIGLTLYCEPGDGAVVMTPIYPPFLQSIAETHAREVSVPLARDDAGFAVDCDALDGAIDKHTRVLLLCNPHNPTGRMFTRRELEGIADVVLRHDLTVMADEIHQDLVYDGKEHIPFASLSSEVEARTMTMTSATKAFNTAGLRCAVVHFGSPKLKDRFNSIPRRVRGGINGIGSAVTRIAWEQCGPWLADTRQHLQSNRNRIAKCVADWSGVSHFPPEATYLAWFDFNTVALDEEPFDLFLRDARVALSEGLTFGEEGRGCVRLNFATTRAILDHLLERMQGAIP